MNSISRRTQIRNRVNARMRSSDPLWHLVGVLGSVSRVRDTWINREALAAGVAELERDVLNSADALQLGDEAKRRMKTLAETSSSNLAKTLWRPIGLARITGSAGLIERTRRGLADLVAEELKTVLKKEGVPWPSHLVIR